MGKLYQCDLEDSRSALIQVASGCGVTTGQEPWGPLNGP